MSKLVFPDVFFDECALCAKSSDLQVSHIIPSFVVRWFRESSATGHLRFAEAPNVRVQDCLKLRMLCKSCEQLFSSWEKNFSEKCFVPINDGRAERLQYEAWMLKFVTSISWRVLCTFTAIGELSEYPSKIRSAANKALIEWSSFLLGNQPHLSRYKQHMYIAGVIEDTTIRDVPPNINRYLTRTVDCDVAHNGHSAFVYSKLGKFIVFGIINTHKPRYWKGTHLNTNYGHLGDKDVEIPPGILKYMFGRARLSAARYAHISESQREKIRQSYEKNIDRAAASDTMHAMHHDVFLFGKKAFEFTQPTMGTKKTESDDENKD